MMTPRLPSLPLVLLLDLTRHGYSFEKYGYTDVLKEVPGIEKLELPTLGFPGMEELALLETPALVTGLMDHPEARRWRAWERWKAESLYEVNDWFGNLELHSRGERVSYFDDRQEDRLNLNLTRPYSIVERTIKEFLDGCRNGELLYSGGGEHPSFNPDVKPHTSFTVDGKPPNVYLYWACPGVCDYLHFDCQGVLLTQVSGEKEVFIMDPQHFSHLSYYPQAHLNNRYSRMQLCPGAAPVDVDAFPRLKNLKQFYHTTLKPGDAVWIPAYWLHTIAIPWHVPISTSVAIKDPVDLEEKINLPSFYKGTLEPPWLTQHRGQAAAAFHLTLRYLQRSMNVSLSEARTVYETLQQRLEPDKATQRSFPTATCKMLDERALSAHDREHLFTWIESLNFDSFKGIEPGVAQVVALREVEALTETYVGPLNLLAMFGLMAKCVDAGAVGDASGMGKTAASSPPAPKHGNMKDGL